MEAITTRICVIRVITIIAFSLLPVAYGFVTGNGITIDGAEAILIAFALIILTFFAAPTLAAGLDPDSEFTWFNHQEWHKQKAYIKELNETFEQNGPNLLVLDKKLHDYCRDKLATASFIVQHGFILNRMAKVILEGDADYVNVLTDLDKNISGAQAYFADKPKPTAEQIHIYFRKSLNTIPERRGLFSHMLTIAYFKADKFNAHAA